MTRWQLHWASLGGYLPFFQLAFRDYLARSKVLAEQTSNEALFDETEIEQRRALHLQKLIESAPNAAEQLSSGKTGEHSKARRFLSALNPFSHRGKQTPKSSPSPAIERLNPAIKEIAIQDLFTAEERQQRLHGLIKKLRRGFRQQHKQALKEVKQYKEVVESLPADDIDQEIWQLEHDYLHLGRVREWYGGFYSLITEVVEVAEKLPPNAELNEDPTRMLQRDFLTTMRTRLATYRRLDGMRREVFRTNDPRAIRLLSYFKLKVPTPDKFIDPPQEFTVVRRFVASLEYQLGLLRAEQAQLQRELESQARPTGPAYVSHENRLEAWQRFKQGTARDLQSLKQITADCEDWQQAVTLFESELGVRRLQNHGLSPVSEQALVQNFVRDMVARIDAEIETDVAFQFSLQDLIVSGEQPELLNLVLEQLKLARSKPDAASEVPLLKADFVKSRAGEVDQQAEVIPLFRR